MAKITEDLPPSFNAGLYRLLPGEAKKSRAREKDPTGKGRPVRFAAVLEESRAAALSPPLDAEAVAVEDEGEGLQELLDEVHSRGDELKQRPFPEEVRRYKRAVRDFLRHIVGRGYTTAQQTGIPNSLKPGFNRRLGAAQSRERNRYTLVQVADRKLEALAAGILAGQMVQVELLARVEEINGLLVDLVR